MNRDHRARAAAGFLLIGIATIGLTGCGGSDLSGASSCQEFMNASSDAQTQVIDQLAAQYKKPEFATPLGAPDVPYFCSSNPQATLDQLFQAAQ